ncbi:uncharacterized protein DUF4426 [Halospina denitrificans]|uniref:Uncharacterized protein DUF4426 n=1 Tax=Halospina denitrificans TaxID=332522 RepID=A0A4R7K1Z8_9GAMM|nr:DUF4426 domain-containing protein [Halospina denitrificans]TDT44394.1 uncharacterized protein DUF4426 [Halospina denitrificans]
MAARQQLQKLLFAFLSLLVATGASAEGKTEFDDFIVYHSAIPSTFISAEMAEEYDLVRSRSMGLLNVSVHRRNANGKAQPDAVGARIEGQMTNSVQQTESLSFQRVREGDAIYYLAQFQYREGKNLVFEIDATPQGSGDPLSVRFSRELYNE